MFDGILNMTLLAYIRPLGWDDGVTIHWRGRSMAI